MTRVIPLIILLSLFAGGCKPSAKQPVTVDSAKRERPSSLAKVEACSLVSKDEVATIQGAQITDTKTSETPQGDFAASQCYYASSAPNMSVTLGVIQEGPTAPPRQTVKEFWHDTFDKYSEEKSEGAREKHKAATPGAEGHKSEEDEEGSKVHPLKIEGVGEAAFWTTSAVGGILYVLERDRMLRVSFGGPDKLEMKLEKSKKMAKKAIAALPK